MWYLFRNEKHHESTWPMGTLRSFLVSHNFYAVFFLWNWNFPMRKSIFFIIFFHHSNQKELNANLELYPLTYLYETLWLDSIHPETVLHDGSGTWQKFSNLIQGKRSNEVFDKKYARRYSCRWTRWFRVLCVLHYGDFSSGHWRSKRFSFLFSNVKLYRLVDREIDWPNFAKFRNS